MNKLAGWPSGSGLSNPELVGSASRCRTAVLTFVFAIAIAACLGVGVAVAAGAVGRSSSPSTAASAPLRLDQASPAATVAINVSKAAHFAVNVVFYFKDESVDEAWRVYQILGSRSVRDASGVRRQPGVPGEFTVVITRSPGNAIVLQKKVDHPVTVPVKGGRAAGLAAVDLSPGDYRIQVSGASGSADVRALRTEVVVVPSVEGK